MRWRKRAGMIPQKAWYDMLHGVYDKMYFERSVVVLVRLCVINSWGWSEL